MKKRIFTLVAAMAAVVLMAACSGSKNDRTYTIKGNVPEAVTAKYIYIYDMSTGMPQAIDSAEIKDHKFTFKGEAPDTVAVLALHPGSIEEYPAVAWTLLLEPGTMVVKADSVFVTGTPLNDGYKDWMTQLEPIFNSGMPDDLGNFIDTHWSEHSNDFLGAFMLTMLASYLDMPRVSSMAADIPEEIRNQASFKPFFDMIAARQKVQEGGMMVDVEMVDMDSAAVKLSDYVGKGSYVLVDFWASWCGPCRQAMPELQSIVAKHKELKVIGIAVSDKMGDTKKAIKDLNIKWPVLFDKPATSAQTYGFMAIPAMSLFGPDGTILSRDFTVSSLEEILAENLK